MPTVQDVLDAIESVAPARFAYSFDKVGLQIGDPKAEVKRLVVSLDPTRAAIEHAKNFEAQMLVSHHPVIWDPIASLRTDSYKGRIYSSLIKSNIAFAAAHTNWDCAKGGINDVLAELIGLQKVQAIGSTSDKEQYKIVVTVPIKSANEVIDAMSSAGAGDIGNYECCAFSIDGTGTFSPQSGASPSIGTVGEREEVKETRIEMLCPAAAKEAVVAVIKHTHPYEEPAIDAYLVQATGGQPIARMGELPDAMSTEDFRLHLDKTLQTRTLIAGPHKQIKRVAVCGGAAAGEWQTDADAFVTGEVPHHIMVEACEVGMVIAAAGHYATEHPGALALGKQIKRLTGTEVIDFIPKQGAAGRPY